VGGEKGREETCGRSRREASEATQSARAARRSSVAMTRPRPNCRGGRRANEKEHHQMPRGAISTTAQEPIVRRSCRKQLPSKVEGEVEESETSALSSKRDVASAGPRPVSGSGVYGMVGARLPQTWQSGSGRERGDTADKLHVFYADRNNWRRCLIEFDSTSLYLARCVRGEWYLWQTRAQPTAQAITRRSPKSWVSMRA